MSDDWRYGSNEEFARGWAEMRDRRGVRGCDPPPSSLDWRRHSDDSVFSRGWDATHLQRNTEWRNERQEYVDAVDRLNRALDEARADPRVQAVERKI